MLRKRLVLGERHAQTTVQLQNLNPDIELKNTRRVHRLCFQPGRKLATRLRDPVGNQQYGGKIITPMSSPVSE